MPKSTEQTNVSKTGDWQEKSEAGINTVLKITGLQMKTEDTSRHNFHFLQFWIWSQHTKRNHRPKSIQDLRGSNQALTRVPTLSYFCQILKKIRQIWENHVKN